MNAMNTQILKSPKVIGSGTTIGITIIATVGYNYIESIRKVVTSFPEFFFWTCVILFFSSILLVWYAATKNAPINIEGNMLKVVNNQADSSIELPNNILSVVIRHESLHTPAKMKKAQNYILLHAAFYPKYGSLTEYSDAIYGALKKNPQLEIRVIITDIKEQWATEFGNILRPYFENDLGEFKKAIDTSIAFFRKIKKDYPSRVQIVASKALPMAPIVIIDNEILVGHYAHATTMAPDGYWTDIYCEKIIAIYKDVMLENKNFMLNLSDEEKALARYIEDFHYAFTNSSPVN